MRYFIVFYTGITTKGKKAYGHITATGNKFISCHETINEVKKTADCKSVVLTNVIELNENDWNTWNN